MFKIVVVAFFLLTSTLFSAGSVSAAEEIEETEETEETEKEPLMYFQITPNILTFYQSTGRKIGYVVVQIHVMVRGVENLELVKHHQPLMLDSLTDFFNRQDKAVITDAAQRENLRLQAKERVATVIREETGSDIVENILFNSYVFQ